MYCENNLCKTCCENSYTSDKEFCIIHDNMVNFFRGRIKELLEFENSRNFDRETTVRVNIRQRMTKSELKEIFDGYSIDWDKVEILFRKGLEKIQFIYLQCTSNEESRRLYEDRALIMKRNEKTEITIQSLLEPLEKIIQSIPKNEICTSGLLVVPTSTLIHDKLIPKKSQRNQTFEDLIQKSLNLPSKSFKLLNCNNLINGEYSYDYFIVQFKSKELLDKFYSMQPFFDCIVFHKLNHLNVFPLLKVNSKQCLNCNKPKQVDCLFELCSDCCVKNLHKNFDAQENLIFSVFRKIDLECNCAVNYQSNSFFNEFDYFNENFNIPISKFVKNYQLKLSNYKARFMQNLRNGDFHWFRPIGETNLTRLMLDMNKELQIVMDNPLFKRENPLRINDKMYKLFTFQIEGLYKKNYNDHLSLENLSTLEGFDSSGEFFVEYDFTNSNNNLYAPNFYVHAKTDKLETLETKFVDKDLLEIENNLKFSFHLILYGLDADRYSTNELITVIYEEIKSTFSKFNKDDIIILDEISVLDFIINQNINVNYEKFNEYGRFALIKFRNEKDAIKMFVEKLRMNFPLVNNKKGKF